MNWNSRYAGERRRCPHCGNLELQCKCAEPTTRENAEAEADVKSAIRPSSTHEYINGINSLII